MGNNQVADNFSVSPELVATFTTMGVSLQEIQEQWSVAFREIEPRYGAYFVKATPSFGFGCVDDRSRVPGEESSERGPQIPGASFGVQDIIKSLTDLNEDEAFDVTVQVLKELDMPLAVHNDDLHGKLTDKLKYKKRNKGCGYEKLVEDEPEKIGLSSDSAVQNEKRWQRVREAGGKVVTLTGDHQPQVAIINLNPDLTFNTAGAYEDNAAFNFDLGWLMETFYPKLREHLKQQRGAQLDRNEFANKALDLYVRTVIVLAPDVNQFQIKAA